MERSYPVERDLHSAAPHAASSQASDWSSWSSTSDTDELASSTFADQMNDLFGAEGEPDPLFFVESWTVGVEAATQNLQARHPIAQPHSTNESSWRPFEFSMPLIIVEDESLFGPNSTSIPTGFSTAWKHAYGVDRSSAPHSASKGDQRQTDAGSTNIPPQGLPLSAEDACRMLGVTLNCTRKQIKTAYRQLVWRYHPDRLVQGSDHDRRLATDRMICLNEAYRLLSDATVAAAN